ncbi:MAG: zf-TFIIB domain-containing protein [Candidatus Binatia bacterium]
MTQPKDPLGDKLRDKGKAAEDLFIAEQERKRLQKLRESAGSPGSALGTCPRDGTKLNLVEDRGVTIDVCPTCRGIWLDQGELEELFKVEDEPGITRWVRSLLRS